MHQHYHTKDEEIKSRYPTIPRPAAKTSIAATVACRGPENTVVQSGVSVAPGLSNLSMPRVTPIPIYNGVLIYGRQDVRAISWCKPTS